MSTLLWLCQNATNWISNPEVEQGEEDQNLLVTSAIAIGAIVTVGALYSLTRRNSSLHIPEGIEHREAITHAFRSLPERLQTRENLEMLIASGEHAIRFACAIGRLSINLLTQDNINALVATRENASYFSWLLSYLPGNLRTQDNRDLLAANGGMRAEIITRAIWLLADNLRTPENLSAFFRDSNPERLQEIKEGLRAIYEGGQEITQQQFDEIIRIADENASYWLKGAVEE